MVTQPILPQATPSKMWCFVSQVLKIHASWVRHAANTMLWQASSSYGALECEPLLITLSRQAVYQCPN